MKVLKKSWRDLLVEPFTWLFYSIFQPNKFRHNYYRLNSSIGSQFRLILPIFIVSFPLCILLQLLLQSLLSISIVSFGEFLLLTAGGAILGALFTIIDNVHLGILGSVAGGMACGILGDTSIGFKLIAFLFIMESIFFFVTHGISSCLSSIFFALGFLIACVVVSIVNIPGDGTPSIINVSISVSMIASFVIGIASIFIGSIRWILSGGDKARVDSARNALLFGILTLIVTLFIFLFYLAESFINNETIRLIFLGFVTIIIAIAILYLFFGALKWITSEGDSKNVEAARIQILYSFLNLVIFGVIELILIRPFITNDTTRGIPESIIMGLLSGGIGGIVGGTLSIGIRRIIVNEAITINRRTNVDTIGFIPGFVWGTIWGILWGVSGNILWSIIGGILLLLMCFLVPYRLPLYPVSSVYMLKAYVASARNPSDVFRYLHLSPIYWDECVFFSLPGLSSTLLIAVQRNVSQTLEEIDFIATERPQQIRAARTALLEIIFEDLERRENLRDISYVSERLLEILPQGAELLDRQWKSSFTLLSEISRDAARACSPLGWQAKHDALEEMLKNLARIRTNIGKDIKITKRFSEIVERWRRVAMQELEELDRTLEKTSRIVNPFSPGPVLESRNRLFVGREELVSRLEEALSRVENRSTFLLNGERRMGKSSVLKQLPVLLGSRYISIYYEFVLHARSSSTSVLLRYIAEKIYDEMSMRGLNIRKLEYQKLQEANRENEAAVYLPFEEWLEQVEKILEKEDRTLLMTFDEFEQLEGAKQKGYLNLELLLSWFRHIMQEHPRIALLFSGTQAFGELGPHWAKAFVNVQVLKVSFLAQKDARKLILHPASNFPSEQIFGEAVVEEILHVTGCHPFFVQGICSALIEYLNEQERFQAEIDDVAIAVDRFLEAWWNTFFRDLWQRTDEMQRNCLFILHQLKRADLFSIAQQSGLDRRLLRSTLENLCERDITLLGKNGYQITTPIFNEWIERSTYR